MTARHHADVAVTITAPSTRRPSTPSATRFPTCRTDNPRADHAVIPVTFADVDLTDCRPSPPTGLPTRPRRRRDLWRCAQQRAGATLTPSPTKTTGSASRRRSPDLPTASSISSPTARPGADLYRDHRRRPWRDRRRTIDVTITGTNDIPTIAGVTTGDVTEDVAVDGTNHINATGQLTIADADTGQSNFTAQAGTAGSNGYGSFTLAADGTWTYTADNTQAAIQQLGVNDSLTDSFTAVSSDGTASQLVTVTIHGTNDAAAINSIATAESYRADRHDPADGGHSGHVHRCGSAGWPHRSNYPRLGERSNGRVRCAGRCSVDGTDDDWNRGRTDGIVTRLAQSQLSPRIPRCSIISRTLTS